MELLDLATFLRLYVVNNLPLASVAFIAFAMFAAFSMLPSAGIHDDARCDATA